MPPKRTQATAVDGERVSKRIKTVVAAKQEAEKAPAKASLKAPGTKKPTAAQAAKKATAAKEKEKAKKAVAPKKAVAKKAAPRPKKAASVAPSASDEESKPKGDYDVPSLSSLKDLPIINDPRYTRILDVFVCGEGANGELGLGDAKGQMDVKRPRLNKFLHDKQVVRVANGGMHVLALTLDNKILSWGVNDEGALGRNTKWDAPTKDMDAAEDSDSDDDSTTGLNPLESTPMEIPSDRFHPGVKFVDIIAGDSCSFALTNQGRVYGWGTFKSNEGTLGLTPSVRVARQPVLLDSLKNITKFACGANHVLALDKKGVVYGFGAGQQHQLARTIIKRSELNATVPTHISIKDGRRVIKIKDVSCGTHNSFAIGENNHVYSWGLNNYAQCGISDDLGDDEGSIVKTPTWIESLKEVSSVEGGNSHSIAVAKDGDILVWGRCDGSQLGIDLSKVREDHIVFSVPQAGALVQKRSPKVVKVPTKVTGVEGKGQFATAGPDHCIAINKAGKAYSWGFSVAYQTGQGTTDDIPVATLIDNTATRDRKLMWAGAGGQYSAFAAYQDEALRVNGTS
ncbi:RCC1/BLIP-II [Pseudovirgaria hyperparasitica]|uniref:RCC1/BLIP-II n=1 Tax=Pseudovirgaria hyperparasitica TaxID=470096 RepID=A0A6A6WGR9_9PEZI|nr:RCC1/BLIP-II [Pseudovirgaria hyperparasitica]KAF2761409.1 RCC1/BLIP-II [Pseudovirgaria hyperparasitica]